MTAEEKRKLLDKLLWANHDILIQLDSSRDDVDVPAQFKGNPALVLKISRNFVGPMELKPEHVWAELKFGDIRYPCIVPYQAIWGVRTEKGENTVWPDSFPKELIEQITKLMPAEPKERSVAPTPQAQQNEQKQGERAQSELKEVEAKPKDGVKKGAHLKRIK